MCGIDGFASGQLGGILMRRRTPPRETDRGAV
jgi:hypothetical protein